jgi:hypothetical protein
MGYLAPDGAVINPLIKDDLETLNPEVLARYSVGDNVKQK